MEKIKCICFILVFLCSLETFAQHFSGKLQAASSEQIKVLDQEFSQYEVYQINRTEINDYVKSQSGVFLLEFSCGKNQWSFQLEAKSMFSGIATIEVFHEEKSNYSKNIPVNTYQGYQGVPQNKSRFFISENLFGATIDEGPRKKKLHAMSRFFDTQVPDDWYVLAPYISTSKNIDNSLEAFSSTCSELTNECSTEPKLPSDGVQRYIEMIAVCDFKFYTNWKGDNCVGEECKANTLAKMVEIIADASGIYQDYFDASIVINHVKIHASSNDGYGNNQEISLNTLKSRWNSGDLYCIPRDVVHLFTAADIQGINGSTIEPGGVGAICYNPEFAYSLTNCYEVENKWYKTCAHELAHGIGVIGHLDISEDSPCYNNCLNANTRPLMCEMGGSLEVDLITRKNQCILRANIQNRPCFTEDRSDLEFCETCWTYPEISVDNLNPTVGCTVDGVVEYTVKVVNGCVPRVVEKIYFTFEDDQHETVGWEEFGDFEYYNSIEDPGIPQGSNRLEIFDQIFEANEIREYKVKLRLLNPNLSYRNLDADITFENNTKTASDDFNFNIDLAIEVDGLVSPALISELYPWSSQTCFEDPLNWRVDGILEVDEFYRTSEGSKIIMNPGSEIIIKDGATLILCNSTISGCSQMWKGITVEEGGTLIVTGSTIEDAEFAITANTHSNVEVRTSIFRNNYVGFYVPESVNGIARDVDVGDFYGNVFEGTSALLDAYPGQENYTAWSHAGVLANDVNNLAIEGVGSVSFIYTNTFRNIRNGIMTYNTSLSLNKARFENIDWVSGNQEGVAVYMEGDGDDWFTQSGVDGNSYTEFTSCRNAIRSVGMNLNVYGNNMEEVVRGISVELSSGREVRIHENTIASYSAGINIYQCAPVQGLIYNNEITTIGSFFSMGIFVNENVAVPSGWNITRNLIQISKGGFGIFHRSGRRTSISNNSIYSFESDYNSNSIGIILEGSPEVFVLSNYVEGLGLSKERNYTNKGIFVVNSPSTTVDCNTVDNSDIGIQYWMNCGGNEFSGNTIKNHQIGLLLGNFNGEVPSGDINFDGQFHTGNKWTDLYSGNEIPSGYLGALNLAPIINDVPSFPYPGSLVVDGNENPFFYPTFEAESNNWIQNFPTDLETFSCRYRVGPQGEVEEDKIFHSNILEDGLPKEDTDLQQKNKAMVLQVSQNTIALEHTKFTKEELKILRSIVIQCPIIGGNAVFEARSLLSAIETVHYEDMDLCQSSKDIIEYKSELQYSSFRVFPNPAKDIVTVSFSTPSEKGRTLHMLNIFGQYLNDYNIAVGEVSIELDVSNYAPGVYTILLSTDGEKKEVQEVVILE